MPTFQYKTIFMKDIDQYPYWQIVSKFTESARILICERSGETLEKCENKECARLGTHKTRPKVTQVETAVICKAENITVP